MDLRRPEPPIQQLAHHAIAYPGQQVSLHTATSGDSPESSAALRIPLNFISQKQALQTLVQPEVPPTLLIRHEIPLPQVMAWSSRDIRVKKIVTPPPQAVAEIDVRPSLDAPNRELIPADIRISASAFTSMAPLPSPSTTSPINVRAAGQVKQIPMTPSKDPGQITPASVISLSDIRLQEGTVVLPLINEILPTPFSGPLTPGQPKSLSQTGSGTMDSRLSGVGAGQATGDAGGKIVTANGPGAQRDANPVTGEGAGADSGLNGERTVVHITLPRGGKFGVVVVGSSPTEDYPETLDLWSGRLAYTVYLHVGADRNWILQYSLPRSKEASSAGDVRRLDAPWPYDLVRPSIDADSNTDAIMVHGFVDAAGRFEHLAVVFPTPLAETQFLLHALQQWRFRPAMQNGLTVTVEVLLVIPNETE